MNPENLHIKIYGIVQGVGFRPFVSRLAKGLGISGSVANRGSYVEIFASAASSTMQEFRFKLISEAPPRSRIVKVTVEAWESWDNCANYFSDFQIIESSKESGAVFVSPDIAICDDCRAELFDPVNRRYLHPFINCTNCGPRLTITEAMPYDRQRTAMRDFLMCDSCADEYQTPANRRYDAQPVCCHDCGPIVYVWPRDKDSASGAMAIKRARQILQNGGIIAVKGIGGFHLAADATRPSTVNRLRALKKREQKPFAVMMKDLATVKRNCICNEAQAKILTGADKPILLLPRLAKSVIADNVAPGAKKLGVMLPYTPLHLLLFAYPDGQNVPPALVMTSGNLSGVPICHTEEEATDLLPICDLILSHNRRIRLRADDSVMDWLEDKPYMIRRSRGFAPLPIMLDASLCGQVLAVGGELKNTFCLARDQLFYPSPYIGDMSDLRAVNALSDSVNLMESLLEIEPELVACDLHPAYHTGEFARSLGKKIFPVQHHYAHVLSCMAENDIHDKVIGVAFDGTGYGTDGTNWGGEILVADASGFARCLTLQPFCQAGGELAAREGWRIALSLMEGSDNEKNKQKIAAELNLCSEAEYCGQDMLLRYKLNAISSTSAGRLFDAVSAILGIKKTSAFEGEAAMHLEYAAWRANGIGRRFCEEHKSIQSNFLPSTDLFNWLLARRCRGENIDQLAYDFHVALADMITHGCESVRELTKLNMVALSGGVFQNVLLTGLTKQALTAKGFHVLTHSLIPPNDGGICLGQALAAMHVLSHNANL